MAKFIFLDIDGVLNSANYINRCNNEHENKGNWVDPRAVAYLNEIIRKTSAKVVISSTWRIYDTLDILRSKLEAAGFIGEIVDKTPVLEKTLDDVWPCRGDEIFDWIDNQIDPPESVVVLDDDGDMAMMSKYLVKTSFTNGLQEEHVEQAVNILNNYYVDKSKEVYVNY